jgi:WD40 repeat protein
MAFPTRSRDDSFRRRATCQAIRNSLRWAKAFPAIWTMGADGSYQKQLASAGHRDLHLSTTADGRYMIFCSNRSGTFEIWRAHPDGSDLKQLTSNGNNSEPNVSPDGRWVVYMSARDGVRTLWRVGIEGGEPVRLTEQPVSWPRISTDGKFIACGFDVGPSQIQLAIIPFAGGLSDKSVRRSSACQFPLRHTLDT